MYTKTAETFFGGKRFHLAQALKDEWSASSVYLWKRVVPLNAARKLAELSEGKLKVLEDLYDDHGSIANVADKILPADKKKKRRA